MPPKKKLKNTQAEYVTRLSSLPSEILFYIYKFLSPSDLMSLSKLGDPRLREVAEFQRELNFSVCWRAGAELLTAYFSRESVKHIQKLNFNAYVLARPSDLVRQISRCKNLVNLSIIDCGIPFKQILKILKNCKDLKELAWSIKEPMDYIEPDFYSSVRKLFLFIELKSVTGNAITFLRYFPKIERAVICYAPDSLIVPPFNTSWSNFISFSSKDNLRRKITILTDDPAIIVPLSDWIDYFFSTYLLDLDSIIGEIRNDDHPPFFRALSQERDISFLSSCSSRSYSNVIIRLSNTTDDVYERLFNSLSKVTGSKLKHLYVDGENYNSSVGHQIPFMEGSRSVNNQRRKISNLLGKLLLDCRNITVLNFGTVHFNRGSPFKAMCNLKNLKFLIMPTCAFPKNLSYSDVLCNEEIQLKCSSFEELVSKCCKVESFDLVCCYADQGRMLDSEIFPIKNWERLTSFTIYSVIFTSCRFLRKIADCCPKFQFFSFITSARNSGCIFYEDVIYLLQHAKNLSFIRINCEHFNPQFERFLNAVSLAKNLEGICILTRVDTCYNTPAFIESIKPLKYLHLFHFHAPRVSERLYTEVKKSMDRNNIKNGKVENDCEDHLRHVPLDFDETNFHTKPLYTCKHIHLKQFLFDNCTYFDIM